MSCHAAVCIWCGHRMERSSTSFKTKTGCRRRRKNLRRKSTEDKVRYVYHTPTTNINSRPKRRYPLLVLITGGIHKALLNSPHFHAISSRISAGTTLDNPILTDHYFGSALSVVNGGARCNPPDRNNSSKRSTTGVACWRLRSASSCKC